MRIEIVLLMFVAIIISTQAEEQVDLGPNLIINNDFSTPDIKAMGFNSLYRISNAILGWNCTVYCQLTNCQGFNLEVQSWNANLFGGECPLQAIETSSSNIEIISQNFEAKAGEHILHLKFLYPVMFARSKILVVMINQQVVYKFHPSYEDFNHKEISMSITLEEGQNKLSFTSEGLDDTFGFRIFDTQIRRKIHSQVTRAIQTLTSNDLLSSSVSIPCSRILFGQLINTMISFDRMQLYYYHHRKYSYYYDVFLKGITDLLSQKGIYAAYASDKSFASIGTSQSLILKRINFKKGRKYKDGYDKNNFMQNGGFFFIFSYIPIAIIIFFCFNILFRLTFSNKFSKIFRKYSFFALILLMLFQGNIQQFSFFIMDEFLEYYSTSFYHKGINILILVIFYFLVFCSTAIYLYCWYIHKKKVSYLTDNIALNMKGMIAYTFDRGIICLLFGSVHRLTLLYGKQQLLILAAVQIFVISFKVAFLLFTSYRCQIIGFISLIEGFIRICFQISIFIYEDSGVLRGFINEEVHLKIIYSFFFLWTLNFVFSIIEVLKSIFHKDSRSNSQRILLKKKRYIYNIKRPIVFSFNAKLLSKKEEKTFKLRIMGKIKKMFI